MAITYDTLGSTVNIFSSGFVPPSGVNTQVAIVGGYDSGNAGGSVAAEEATVVKSSTEAENKFGADSELAYQAKTAFAAGASAVHGVPLPETTPTESFGGTATGTLSNVPFFDPRVHPDQDVTAQDTQSNNSVDVTVVDANSPSTPSSSDTINLSAATGNWEADSSSDYDITYTYSTYQAAINTAANRAVRTVAVCTENDSVINTAQTELSNAAESFQFGRGVVGSSLSLSPSGVNSYAPAVDDWRIIEVTPSRATYNDTEVRTVGAIAGLVAAQPIDVTGSITYDSLNNIFDSLGVEFSPVKASNFERVTAITDEFEIAEGVTTESQSEFQDIYKAEIIDFTIEQLFARIKSYRGGSNTLRSRRQFESRLRNVLSSYATPNASPPLLATGDGSKPYSISVTRGSADDETAVSVGINVAPIAKEITLDVSTGPLQLTGVNA